VDGLILRVAVLPVDYSISLRELTVHEILSIYLSIYLSTYHRGIYILVQVSSQLYLHAYLSACS